MEGTGCPFASLGSPKPAIMRSIYDGALSIMIVAALLSFAQDMKLFMRLSDFIVHIGLETDFHIDTSPGEIRIGNFTSFDIRMKSIC